MRQGSSNSSYQVSSEGPVLPDRSALQVRKNMAKRSKSTFIFWAIAMMLIMRVTIFIRPRSIDDFTEVDMLGLINIVLVAISFVVVLPALFKKSILQRIKGSSLKYLILYYLLCAISGLWSANPYFSLFRSLEMISQILLVSVAISYEENFESAEKRFLFIGMFMILAGIIMHLNLYDWQISLATLHTNSYSLPAAIMVVYCFHEWLNAKSVRKSKLFYYLVFSGVAVIIGTSSGSLIAAIIGFGISGIFQKKIKKVLFLIFLIFVILFILFGGFDAYWREILFHGKTEQGIITMSGRVNLWDQYIGLIKEKPFRGYGFLIVARMGDEFGSVNVVSAHNGYFEVLLGTGFAGGFLFILWLIKLSKELKTTYKIYEQGIIGTIGAVSVVLINNFTIPVIGGGWNSTNTVFLALLALFIFFRVRQYS